MEEEVINNQDITPKSKKKLNILRNILNWVFTVIISLFVIYIGCRIIDNVSGYRFPFFGFRSSVIVSESMAYANPENDYLTDDMKRIDKYDVIITQDYKSYDDIELYDVVTYLSGDIIICHRVVKLYEKNGKQYIVTRGDSNNANDSAFEYSAIRGKVVNNLKGIGHFVLFVQSYEFLFVLFGSGFFILLGIFIFNYKDKKEIDSVSKKKKKDEHETIE